MANAQFKDATGATKYRKATGAGTDIDPFILDNTISAIAAGDNNIGNVDLASAIPAGTNNIGDVDVLSIAAGDNNIGNVDIASIAAGDNNIGNVDLASAIPAGTNNIGDVDVLTLPGVKGSVAHDGADADAPVKVGAKAIAHGTNPTAVAAADVTDLYANRAGVLFTIGGHPNQLTLAAAYTAAQTDTAIITAAGGAKIVVTGIEVTADKANTVDVGFYIGFHATTTPTTTGVVAAHPGLAAGSGLVKGNGGGILGVGGDGDDLRITSEVPTTGSIRVVVTYFTIES